MRVALWIGLLAGILFAVSAHHRHKARQLEAAAHRHMLQVAGAREEAGRSSRTGKAVAGTPLEERNERHWIEDGYGQTPADAEEVALKRARDTVRNYVAQQYGSINWEPSREYLQRAGVICLEGDPETIKTGLGETALRARARVVLTDEFLQEMRQKVWHHRGQQRQFLLARALGGLVVLLLMVLGYLRVQDCVGSCCRAAWIRRPGLGVLILVGIGLLVLLMMG